MQTPPGRLGRRHGQAGQRLVAVGIARHRDVELDRVAEERGNVAWRSGVSSARGPEPRSMGSETDKDLALPLLDLDTSQART